MTGGVERYRPVPAIPGPHRPARAVLLYFDDDGRRMAGWEWTRPEVTFEAETECASTYGEPFNMAVYSTLSTTYTATVSGCAFRGITIDREEQAHE